MEQEKWKKNEEKKKRRKEEKKERRKKGKKKIRKEEKKKKRIYTYIKLIEFDYILYLSSNCCGLICCFVIES